ncbi:MARVEL domain-containing 1 [Pelobates cultripes]|uniref:MARVEL domain-containing 1 n=1 Tax=Pelobates cultripes TaxID=61616 RepID=A0AAD1TEI3_PELCU|nr:MARVEL domain-containing 1 [Pelobates cultripes]
MHPAHSTRSSVSANKQFLKSLPGVLRVLQLVSGAGIWITIASNHYGGSIHFALFVAVFFWLLTLVIYFLTLLDKQELVPILGAERWVFTNAIYDALATVLHIAAAGIMISKTKDNEYCNLETYKLPCLFKAYLTASIFACICCILYAITCIYFFCKKCRGNQSVVYS